MKVFSCYKKNDEQTAIHYRTSLYYLLVKKSLNLTIMKVICCYQMISKKQNRVIVDYYLLRRNYICTGITSNSLLSFMIDINQVVEVWSKPTFNWKFGRCFFLLHYLDPRCGNYQLYFCKENFVTVFKEIWKMIDDFPFSANN